MIFPSGSHAVGRSGTSFSGARAEFTWGNKGQQSSARAALRHQDSAILNPPVFFSLFHFCSCRFVTQTLKSRRKFSNTEKIPQHSYYKVHINVIKLHELMIHWNNNKKKSLSYPIQTELFMSGIRNCLNIWLWDVWVAQLDIHCKKSPLFKVWSGLQIRLWSQWLHIFTSIFSWKVQIFLKVLKSVLFDSPWKSTRGALAQTFLLFVCHCVAFHVLLQPPPPHLWVFFCACCCV